MSVRLIVTANDCRRDTFRCGGHGGQNVQKRDTGVWFSHAPSGAVGEATDHRTQLQNERLAWRRMAEHPRFKLWYQMTLSAMQEGYASIEARVSAQMREENLMVELGVPARPGDLKTED